MGNCGTRLRLLFLLLHRSSVLVKMYLVEKKYIHLERDCKVVSAVTTVCACVSTRQVILSLQIRAEIGSVYFIHQKIKNN